MKNKVVVVEAAPRSILGPVTEHGRVLERVVGIKAQRCLLAVGLHPTYNSWNAAATRGNAAARRKYMRVVKAWNAAQAAIAAESS